MPVAYDYPVFARLSQRCPAALAGIWGGKGQGKTFQCNLAFKKLDIAPIVMSAGELESGNAGEPAKLIRQRYREVRFTFSNGTVFLGKDCSACLHPSMQG